MPSVASLRAKSSEVYGVVSSSLYRVVLAKQDNFGLFSVLATHDIVGKSW